MQKFDFIQTFYYSASQGQIQKSRTTVKIRKDGVVIFAEANKKSVVKAENVLHMFPTCVWRVQFQPEIARDVNARLMQAVEALRREDSRHPMDQPWQSRQDLHDHPGFRELVSLIDPAVQNVLDYLKVADCDHQFTGAWINMGPPGAAHRLHSHANNFLSCVYYLRTGQGADTITFYDPRFQNQVVLPTVTERTPENASSIDLGVEEGSLVLFPSWLPHSVPPNAGDEMRISIAFNVMFSKFAETIAQPNWS